MLRKILIVVAVRRCRCRRRGARVSVWRVPKMRPAPEMTAPNTPEALDRGRYLAEGHGRLRRVSLTCRRVEGRGFPPGGARVSRGAYGRPGRDSPGQIVAPNITPDPETGIGRWTDGEVARAIREGVSRDGRPLFPLMNYPAYRDLTDADVLSIVAYLRTRKPVRRDNGRSDLDFPVGMMIRTVPQPLDHSPAGLPAAGVERGRAMLKLMLCGECHTPRD